MKAKDVMSRQVISIEPGMSVQQSAQLMLHRRISGLPVISGRLVGIVTEADFLRRAETGLAGSLYAYSRCAERLPPPCSPARLNFSARQSPENRPTPRLNSGI
jgi:CBS-domain-containing membrane protein